METDEKPPANPQKNKGGRPRKDEPPKLTAELVAASLAKLHGNIATVAAQYGVSRSTLTEFIRARPALGQVLTDAREGMKDHAESMLYKAIFEREGWAICFFLKCQAKERGYLEKPPQEEDKASDNTTTGLLAAVATLLARQQSQSGGIVLAPSVAPVDAAPRTADDGVSE